MNSFNINVPILDILCDVKCMLAGGSCLSLGNNTKFNDYDIFFETEEEYNKAYYILSQKARVDFTSYNACTFYYKSQKIQLVKIFKKFMDTIDDFDIDNSKLWSFPPFKEVNTNQSLDIFFTLKLSSEPSMNRTKRILKYYDSKQINIDSYVPTLFDEFLNYKNQNYENTSYSSGILDIEKFIGYLIYCALKIPEFKKYVQYQENNQKRLPYEIASELPNVSGIKTLEFFKSGLNKDWMRKNFPEEFL